MQTLEQLRSGQLKGITHLKLSCGLTEFPGEIFELAETLEVLDLSGNQLSELPYCFSRLKKLRILFLSDNKFTVFPEVLSQCTWLSMIGFKANHLSYISENALPASLRWLILTNNRLEYLPKSIGKCSHLQKVALAGNWLRELPNDMANCKKIELLRISANKLINFPHWLLSLPRLSWLAFSGNEFNKSIHASHELASVPWTELSIKELLGEGASGLIYSAQWKNANSERDVAVKVFKGQVTSDGLPEDEMNACIQAGEHPHLVKALGRIVNHPDSKNGLVLDLIPSSFKNLGGPPNFQTCTRDTFSDQAAFSIRQILAIAIGIADVTTQLHSRGITHGDLYAHNILVNEKAYPLLTDFGAASFYDKNEEMSSSIQGIEVRAFGCLLDDLLAHRDRNEIHHSLNVIAALRTDCLNEHVSKRPDFAAILSRLMTISLA